MAAAERPSEPRPAGAPAARAGTLVIHPGALGDVLLAVPALRALRAAAPEEPLTLAAQPHLGALAAALGLADRPLALERLGLEALFVDDGAPPRAPALAAAARVVCWLGAGDPVFVARLRRLAPTAVVASTRPTGGALVWEHLLGTTGLAPAGAGSDAAPGLCAPVPVPPALEAAGARALRAAGWDGTQPLLVVHPGAGGRAKRWPVEAFARVLDAVAEAGVDCAVALSEGPADAEAVAALAPRLRGPTLVLHEFALPVLAGALRHARAWLGNDSGATHLAAAVGAPTVALFVAPNLPWRPWSPTATVLVVDTARAAAADVDRVAAALVAALRGAPLSGAPAGTRARSG